MDAIPTVVVPGEEDIPISGLYEYFLPIFDILMRFTAPKVQIPAVAVAVTAAPIMFRV